MLNKIILLRLLLMKKIVTEMSLLLLHVLVYFQFVLWNKCSIFLATFNNIRLTDLIHVISHHNFFFAVNRTKW